MATQNLLDEKHITNARVYIAGEELDIVYMSLEQIFGDHHKFSVSMDYDTLKKRFMNNPIEQMQLIGSVLDIDLQQGNDSANAYEFRGIIQDVKFQGMEGKHGYLVLEGMSTTILLERGKRLDIFSNMDLAKVFEEVTDGVSEPGLSIVNKPIYTANINFLMQYQESDWQFLRRLSAISGETLYYTGRDLVFGTHKEFPTIKVTYDKEITNFEFGAKLLPNNFTLYHYLAEKDDTINTDAPEDVEDSNNFIDMAAMHSSELTKKRPIRKPVALPVDDIGILSDMAIRQKTATASQTIYIKGTAKTCAPRIGRLLTIEMPDNMPEADPIGTYRIIKVKHIIDQNHHYRCEFEGIPSTLKYVSIPEISMPIADSILATVISNEDPLNQGRVKVEFPFAKDRINDTWFRVMTPTAGGLVGYDDKKKGIVEKNRGMVFIPEEGDQVMVGFEFGDPNRPYIAGSMFHGKNAEGGGNNNLRKSIITRSGSKLEFTDTEDENKYTVILQHNDQNTISISVEKEKGTIKIESTQDIFIKAPELIQLEAKQIIMKAEDIQAEASNNIEMVAQSLFHTESADKLEILAANIAEESSGNFTQKADSMGMQASSKMDIEGGSKMNIKAGNIKMNQ